MTISKRHTEILHILAQEGSISVADLAARLEISLETVRRDVKPLAQSGQIVKMHGAIGLPAVVGEAPFDRRMRENRNEKRAIAKHIAASIDNGQSVMLDTGTTTSFLARELLDHRKLVVVTNSSDIARILATVNGNRVFMAGGELRSDNGAALGFSALEFVSKFSVDHAIISTGAVHAEHGIVDYELEEAEFGRAVLSRGKRRVVITDHSKFGKNGLVKVCDFNGIDLLCTNQLPPEPIRARLQEAGVKIELAEPLA